MKKIMKKALSLMLALVMVFSLAPMTAQAAAGDSQYEAITLDGTKTTHTVNIASGATVYYSYQKAGVYGGGQNYDITVTGTSYDFSAAYMNNYGMPVSVNPNPIMKAEFSMMTGVQGTVVFSITNSSDAAADFTIDTEYVVPAPGSMDLPDTELTLDTLTTVDCLEENWGNYYYYWEATKTGTFTITIADECLEECDWVACIQYIDKVDGTTNWEVPSAWKSDGNEPTISVAVEEGDLISFYVSNFNIGEITFTATISEGTSGPVDPVDPVEPIEPIEPIEPDDANYFESDVALVDGVNVLTVSPMYEYTVYVFEPTKAGKYTLTTTDSVIGIVGYYYTMDSLVTGDVVKETTIEWECENVGPSIYVAVKADANVANIMITREDLVEDEGPTYTTYVNKVTPEAYTFAGNEDNLIYINVTDDIEDVIVLGKDGYYHFGTENGPIVLVDLANETYSLAANVGTAEEPGPAPAKDTINMVDYTVAMQAYVAAADKTTSLYPLTEDLMTAYKNYGESQGWYGNVLGFPLFENEMDPEKAWMFACCYIYEVVEGDNATWTQGSSEGLTLKANGNFAEFIGLKVDGVEVDKANYTAKEGSTIVTLSKDYLATLAVGDHTVTFVYENNGFEYTADATITIATPVKTGDATNIALWIAVLGLGVVAIAGSVVMRKREF